MYIYMYACRVAELLKYCHMHIMHCIVTVMDSNMDSITFWLIDSELAKKVSFIIACMYSLNI